MIKAILLDADGLVIQGRERYFSEILAEEKGINIEDVLKFFKGDYKKCVLGKAELKDEISKFLDTWKWDGSVDELVEYWFSFDGKPSDDVLVIVKQLRDSGTKVYLVSDHTKYRADDIMNRMGMNNHFDGGFFSYDFGCTKGNGDFYANIMKKLGLHPNEMLFWDDEEENVEAAKKAGLVATLYTNIEKFKKKLYQQGFLK